MTTDTTRPIRTREQAARRYAEERGLKLRKSRTTGTYRLENWTDSGVDLDALAYLRAQLLELGGPFDRYLPAGTLEVGYPLTLDEAEAVLEAPTVYEDGFKFTRAPAVMRCQYRNR